MLNADSLRDPAPMQISRPGGRHPPTLDRIAGQGGQPSWGGRLSPGAVAEMAIVVWRPALSPE